jgi:hypothetical protein
VSALEGEAKGLEALPSPEASEPEGEMKRSRAEVGAGSRAAAASSRWRAMLMMCLFFGA